MIYGMKSQLGFWRRVLKQGWCLSASLPRNPYRGDEFRPLRITSQVVNWLNLRFALEFTGCEK